MPGIQIRRPTRSRGVTDDAPARSCAGPTSSSSGSSSTRTLVRPTGSGARPVRNVASTVPVRTASTAVSSSCNVTTSSSTSGWTRWKSCNSVPAGPRRPITSTRNARLPGRTAAVARATAVSTSRACGRNACPSAVSRAPLGVRVNSRVPSVASSDATRLDTACCDTPSSCAASWNCPCSATATNVRTASRSTRPYNQTL